jgi:hypothetical protein
MIPSLSLTSSWRNAVAALRPWIALALVLALLPCGAQTPASAWRLERTGPGEPVALKHVAIDGLVAVEVALANREGHVTQAQLVHVLPVPPGHKARVQVDIAATASSEVQLQLRQRAIPYDVLAVRTMHVGPAWQHVSMEVSWPSEVQDGDLRVVMRSGDATVRVRSLQITDLGIASLGEVLGRTFPDMLNGVHVNQLGRHFTWPDTRPRLIRLWDTRTNWDQLAPTLEEFDTGGTPGFKRIDAYLDYVRRNDPSVTVLYVLGQPPRWASDAPDERLCAYGTGTCGGPASMDVWRHYVHTLAQRYKGRIRYWELWNEANVNMFFNSRTSLAELAKAAKEELRAVDASNRLLSPGFTRHGLHWMHDFLRTGGGEAVDGIAFHWYFSDVPEDIGPWIQNVRAQMQADGAGKLPLWNTEGGFVCQKPGPCKEQLRQGSSGGVIERALMTMWLNGVDAFAYYTVEGTGGTVPLLGTNLRGLSPAGATLRTFLGWLQGASADREGSWGDHGHWVALRRPGSVDYLVWQEMGRAAFSTPAEWGVNRVHDLNGGSQPLPQSMLAGPEPLLLSK